MRAFHQLVELTGFLFPSYDILCLGTVINIHIPHCTVILSLNLHSAFSHRMTESAVYLDMRAFLILKPNQIRHTVNEGIEICIQQPCTLLLPIALI